MKTPLTIFLLFLFTGTMAQRVKFSLPEKQYPGQANFEIIGQVSGHYLIFLEGNQGAELALFDEELNKIGSVPANFLKTKAIHKDFFVHPDHYTIFLQYNIGSTFYIGRLTGNGNGDVTENMMVMDSVEAQLSSTTITISNGRTTTSTARPTDPSIELPRMFIVLRSENKQWFMILKGVSQVSTDQQLEATLYDKDFRPVEHERITYSTDKAYGEFSEFILDNDGDLAFVYASEGVEAAGKPAKTELFLKQQGVDTLVSADLSIPGKKLDKTVIREDNLNHRYILNSFYLASGQENLTGLCSQIWDKRSQSMASRTLTPLSTALLSEARSDFTPPERVLNNYYLRQVLPFADGGFMVLAELCYGSEKFSNYNIGLNRYDFIRGKPFSFTPSFLSVNNSIQDQPASWRSSGRDRFGNRGAFGIGRNTDNLLVFTMDREGKASSIKVLHKSEYTTPGMEPLSYQIFNDGRAIHLLYNENIKGHWLPVGTSIKVDGTIEPEPVLHSLDRDQILYPRFGKQVGPKTALIPCQIGGYLAFARVDY